jgi:NADH-quinone oxidoreductase subunit F
MIVEKDMPMTGFLTAVLQKETEEHSNDIYIRLEELRRNRITKPLILVSSGTSAMVAGADKTFTTVQEYIGDRNIKAETARCGCFGIMNLEPVLSVQLPGRTRLSFANITAEKVTPLLDDVFHNTIPKEYILCQHRNSQQDGWPDVPFMDEIPFFAGQHRLLLKDCGFIDPGSIAAYIANGGYRAFIKAIRDYTYEEICHMVEESGLRGRSGSGFNAGKKWKTANQTSADQKYLICNAEESDPWSIHGQGNHGE